MKWIVSIATTFLIVVSLVGSFADGIADQSPISDRGGKVVIANRGSGTISVISAHSNEVIGTFDLPGGAFFPEPMYVVYSAAKHRVFVGDRANDRVVVFDAGDFSVEGEVEAGSGVFHMWADGRNKQLWVNNDIDNTSTVIDPNTLEILAIVPTPADLVSEGGKPHDVILDPRGIYAYVSVTGLPGDDDYVVQYSTDTFEEVGRAAVGKDPHVSLARQNEFLYVPSQGEGAVFVFDRWSLGLETILDVPGAHGAGMTRNGRYFYTTNLPGEGIDGLFAIDTEMNSVIGATDTPYPVPHNIALTPSGRKLFLTHSGDTSDKVTIYRIRGNDPVPLFSDEVTVGFNPFGLAYVP
jgi:DNA-binding beta-propeller fold protein YncE